MKGFLILSVIFLFSFASVYCQIATQPSDTTICNGDTAIFNISVNGASLSYQWEESIDNGSSWDTLYNGLSYSGVNSDSFSILATTHFYNGNKYRCLVDTNGAQFEISDTATLYIDSLPTAYAGSDQSLCAYDNLLVNDAYNTSSSIIWTHTGIGTLTGTTTISPAYTPDSTESNNIYLILSVTSNNSCGLAMVVDSMRLTIDTIPNAYAGPNDTICASSSFISVQSSGLFSSLFWSASCCGTLQNDSTLNPTFVPDSGQSGIKTLIMTTTCRFDTVRDTMQLTLDTLPTSYAGPNDTTCTATSFFLDQSSGIYSSVLWSASCCGTLLNDSTLNPTLLPDSGQIGNLFLIMTTYCRSDSIKDTMQLTVDT